MFYAEIGEKNTELEKWEKNIMIRVQLCVSFFVSPPFIKKSFSPVGKGEGVILQNIYPCFLLLEN